MPAVARATPHNLPPAAAPEAPPKVAPAAARPTQHKVAPAAARAQPPNVARRAPETGATNAPTRAKPSTLTAQSKGTPEATPAPLPIFTMGVDVGGHKLIVTVRDAPGAPGALVVDALNALTGAVHAGGSERWLGRHGLTTLASAPADARARTAASLCARLELLPSGALNVYGEAEEAAAADALFGINV